VSHFKAKTGVLPNGRAEAPREASRPWPAADNELATQLPAKGSASWGRHSSEGLVNTKSPLAWIVGNVTHSGLKLVLEVMYTFKDVVLPIHRELRVGVGVDLV